MALIAATPPLAFLRACLQSLKNMDAHPLAPINIPNSSTAFLDVVMSTANMRHWRNMEVTFPGKGKIGEGNFPKVYVEFTKPNCDTPCADISAFGACGTGGSALSVEKIDYLELQIDDSCGEEWSMTKAQFVELCGDGSQAALAEELRRNAATIKRNIATKGIEAFLAAAGPYPDGVESATSPKTVTVVNENGNIVPAGFAKIKGTYRKNKYGGKVLTVGSDMLATYFDVQALQGGGQNATGKVDPLPARDFTYDEGVDTVVQAALTTTDSYGFTFPEGAFGIVFWNEYTGINQESHENHLETTLSIDGIKYDFYITYSICDKEWKTGIKTHFTWLDIPSNLYCNGESYKWLWKFDCGVFDCDAIRA